MCYAFHLGSDRITAARFDRAGLALALVEPAAGGVATSDAICRPSDAPSEPPILSVILLC